MVSVTKAGHRLVVRNGVAEPRTVTTAAGELEIQGPVRGQGAAAPGVDGQRYQDYAASLDENLWDLYRRLKSGRYRAPVIRRVYIPKGTESFGR